MMFQLFALLLIILIVGRVSLQYRRKAIGGKEFLFWSLFWMLAATAIMVPHALTFLANILGIGRGTDLAFYTSFVIVGFMFFRMVVRIDKMERDITKVVRHLALEDQQNLTSKVSVKGESDFGGKTTL